MNSLVGHWNLWNRVIRTNKMMTIVMFSVLELKYTLYFP